MRLTDIRLSGFKSFPEPTHIAVPGQLVGIVGPNGCGKSNVIDAVRWVLGESQAKHLRGETMQDVIFNGTNDRKPVSRSSVELVFDNSLGRAPGQWATYAQISVKRILERNGESSYYINNSHVRRRDITDIFMGTGLGPRAYAIIEQGMISRIIESKPEELRIFLEEAAGVSKYKDRRRETELRLGDARENMARVEDIRTELGTQIVKLQGQAEAATRYQELQTELRKTQNLLFLIRKRDAGAARERAVRDVERLATELEAETARLRDAEKRLETTRQAHYSASDTVHTAQGELYTANAEVARIENQLQFVRESRRRLESQRDQLAQQLATLTAEQARTLLDSEQWQSELQSSITRFTAGTQQVESERSGFRAADEAYGVARQRLEEVRSRLAQEEQAKSVAEAHRSHAARVLETLTQRREKLSAELEGLVMPETSALEQASRELTAAFTLQQELDGELTTEQALTRRIETELAERSKAVEVAQANVTRVEAQIHALEKLQSPQTRDEKVKAFLLAHGLDGLPRLWQSLQVEAGWEDAIESVLGMRLNALRIESLHAARNFDPPPPPGVTFFSPDRVGSAQSVPALVPLRRYIVRAELEVEGVLADLLAQVYAAESWHAALTMQSSLPSGAVVVSRDGHIVTRTTVSFFAPQAEMHGLLARSRELEELRLTRIGLGRELTEKQESLAQAQDWNRDNRERLAVLQTSLNEAKAKHHQWQMTQVQITQQAERASQRREQVERELAEIQAQSEIEAQDQAESLHTLEVIATRLEVATEELEQADQTHRETEHQLHVRRAALQAAEKAEQEARFAETSCREKIAAISAALATIVRRVEEIQTTSQGVETELAQVQDAALSEELQRALVVRQERESALGTARQRMEEAVQSLNTLEQERLASEQKLQPMRDKINELKLKEQEARINEESLAEQLRANGGDEQTLMPLVERGMRASGLQNEINRINTDVEVLGPVNLAALSELTVSTERKDHLDHQWQDLTEAVETLESAIRRIDRETRERLQETFDKVNANFSSLFPSLFGGGQARIELTGDEILDAGVQVIAQPPGKRTTSIHLLSGGEKALTAMALVFSMFQLNPAPFCLLDEVDAPLDDANTDRFCQLVSKMSKDTQFLFISHNKLTMEMASHLVGITMQEFGVSRVVAVDMEEALRLREEVAA